jgi:hypothetical protein
VKPKPSTSFDVERIPLAMCSARRWINWYPEWKDDSKKKWTKIPCDATGRKIDATDPSNGRTLSDARDAADASLGVSHAKHPNAKTADGELGLGLGFMLGDGWLGVDLDGVVDPATGRITDPEVEAWLATTESYVETTPSKTGLHVIFKGVGIPAWSQNRRGFVEVYAEKRFFTVTGHARYVNRDVLADQAAVDALCDKWLRKDKPKPPSPAGAKRKRNPDASADDYSLACDLARKGTPRAEIEAKLAGKMIAEGRGDKAGRADYVPRTVDAAERAVEADPTPPGAKTADKLVVLALDRFELGRTPKGETFAVEKTGANVAIRLDGSAMKSTLASLYFDEHASVAGSAALEDALGVLRGQAMKTEPRELAIRYGRDGDKIVADLGRVDGKAVVIDAAGWRLVDRSPILFERTELVGELPIPVGGGTVEELRGLLNIGDADFDVLVGWIVAAMIPEIAHPILMLGGGQGTGKTTAATMIVGVLDASDAPTRTQPRDPESYALSVAGSWATVFDNVSKIPEWQSDALCKTVTGDAFTKRKLYADRELSVVSFRRVVAITTIDAGALRGDLVDRIVLVELDKIDKTSRRSESEIKARFEELRPRILGAFLTLLSKTLAALSRVHLKELPRMADFAKVLDALDMELGTSRLATYLGQGSRLADDVVEGDSVGTAIRGFMESRPTGWSGNCKMLLEAIKPDDPAPRDFPTSPKGLESKLKRLAPALEELGVFVQAPRKNEKTRTWGIFTAQTAQPPENPTGDA